MVTEDVPMGSGTRANNKGSGRYEGRLRTGVLFQTRDHIYAEWNRGMRISGEMVSAHLDIKNMVSL